MRSQNPALLTDLLSEDYQASRSTETSFIPLVAEGRFGPHFSRKLVIPLCGQKVETKLRGQDLNLRPLGYEAD